MNINKDRDKLGAPHRPWNDIFRGKKSALTTEDVLISLLFTIYSMS
jgi:hypothetical protein